MNNAILKKYENEIYPFKVWVAIAQDRDEILKKFVDYIDGNPLKDIPQTDFVQYVEEIETENYGALIVFYDESRLTHRTVTHEVVHAVEGLLQIIGNELSGGEQTAYLAGWIADCCEKTKAEISKTQAIKTDKSYFEIGEMLQLGFCKLKCVNALGGCAKCYFNGFHECNDIVGKCHGSMRPDKKSVFFVKA